MALKPLKPSKQKRKEQKYWEKHQPLGSEAVPLLPPTNEQNLNSAEPNSEQRTKL